MAKKPKFDRSDKFVYSEADIDALIKNPTDAERKAAQPVPKKPA